MTKNRLEAFSDGVLAIIITIMVLELRPPHTPSLAGLAPLLPTFLSYALSFLYVGIYWNNHHHLFQVVQKVNGKVLWANLHLLFWLSLLPFVTAWMRRGGALQCGPGPGGPGLLHPHPRPGRPPRPRLGLGAGRGAGPQGPGEPPCLYGGHPPDLPEPLAGAGPRRGGGPGVAGAGPADGADPGEILGGRAKNEYIWVYPTS